MDIQILIGSEKEPKNLEYCLIESGYRVLAHCSDGQEILRRITIQKVDLIILEMDIKGGSVKELVQHILHVYHTPVILLANDAEAVSFYDLVEQFGFACIQKPLSKQGLLQSITLLVSGMETIRILKQEVSKLERQLNAKNQIEKAKEVLMSERQMSEQEAHRYLQKESMDKKLSKEQVAKNILKEISWS